MYFISRYMTKPLEKLNHVSEEIAQGDYATRVNVKSHDEIGLLAQKFNIMAQAVSDHVDELNDMVHRREQFVADFTHEIKNTYDVNHWICRHDAFTGASERGADDGAWIYFFGGKTSGEHVAEAFLS